MPTFPLTPQPRLPERERGLGGEGCAATESLFEKYCDLTPLNFSTIPRTSDLRDQ